MAKNNPIVFLVDDDPSVLRTLPRALEYHGLTVHPFDSAKKFLESYNNQHGCLVLDLSMPEVSGLELQAELSERGITIPIIFITGHGGVTESVTAMRAGAVDFLEKPFLPEILLERISEATAKDFEIRQANDEKNTILSRFHKLTGRELEVYKLLIEGETVPSSKVIASELGISHRTVEHHRARILEKTICNSLPELRVLAKEVGFVVPNNIGNSAAE